MMSARVRGTALCAWSTVSCMVSSFRFGGGMRSRPRRAHSRLGGAAVVTGSGEVARKLHGLSGRRQITPLSTDKAMPLTSTGTRGPDGPARGGQSEPAQFTVDSAVLPRRVLRRQSQHQVADLRAGLRTAWPTRISTCVWSPAFTRRLANPLAMRLNARGVATLTLVGRRTGETRKVPVIPVEVGGSRHLVPPYGGSDWVRNLPAAG